MNVCPGNCRICSADELRVRRAFRTAAGVLACVLGALLLSLSGCAAVRPYVTGPCASVSEADALKALPDVTALVVCEKNGGDCTTLDAQLVSDGLTDAANLKACASSKVNMSTGEGQ